MTTQASTTGITPPKIHGGQEVYDSIMGDIEPELTTAGLATLDEKYKDETAEAAAERLERYKKAFEEYNKRYAEYKQKQDDAVKKYGRDLAADVENKASAKDATALDDIESAIFNS